MVFYLTMERPPSDEAFHFHVFPVVSGASFLSSSSYVDLNQQMILIPYQCHVCIRNPLT